jgi:hypothetical protein
MFSLANYLYISYQYRVATNHMHIYRLLLLGRVDRKKGVAIDPSQVCWHQQLSAL